MAYIDEHKAKFENLKAALDIKNRTQLSLVANGGYTIMFTYPPNEESLYIKKVVGEFNSSEFNIIDISKIFVEYIDEDGIDEFLNFYDSLSPSSHKAFFDTTDPHIDLFDKVINKIVETSEKGLIPILIRTGVFYGTGIENINLTQNKTITELNIPLVIFYPGEIKGSHHHFLNAKQSSNYRCTII
jgi:hypothetical protein